LRGRASFTSRCSVSNLRRGGLPTSCRLVPVQEVAREFLELRNADAKPLSGTGNRSFECTIGVESIEETATAIVKHDGHCNGAVHHRRRWHTALLHDTEGNRVGTMQYAAESSRAQPGS
jgi:hypothetical protein